MCLPAPLGLDAAMIHRWITSAHGRIERWEKELHVVYFALLFAFGHGPYAWAAGPLLLVCVLGLIAMWGGE